jgi:lactocepin
VAASPEVVAEAKRVVRAGGAVFLMGGPAALGDGVEAAFRAAGLTTVRVAGANRFETAVATAELVNADPTTILVTSGMTFADAMAATPVAGKVKAPIVLVDGDTMPAASLAYLAQHPLATRVVIGGTASVGASAAALALTTDRVAGPDRYATSAAVARRWFTGSSSLVTANGASFQDAAIGGPIAARLGAPVLLTSTTPTRGTYDHVHGVLRGLRDVRVLASDGELPRASVSLLFS